MRPPRQDIAAPPFPPGLPWLGGIEPRLERLLAAGPLLVHFFDFAQLNSLRAMTYLRAWRERYAEHGLVVLGVHSPRLSLTRSPAAVAAALPGLGITWPVAVDSELRAFRDYGCRGWPSLFLWGRGGALRWYHLGEGEYTATEGAIREQLGEPPGGWPEAMEPRRPGDAPGAEVIVPSAELFPGGADGAPWRAGDSDGELEIPYAAAGAYAAADGEGRIEVRVDGGAARAFAVAGPGLYELAASERHGEHLLALLASPGVSIHSIQFAAAPS